MLGISLGLTARLNSSAFSPLSLFGLTDTGWFYDHSDFSTLFQDAAGTIPVTAVGQPVGLQLDKSKGLVLGPELVTNGDFSSGSTGWTGSNGTFSVASGQGTVTNSVAGVADVRIINGVGFTTQVGRTYRVTGTLVGATGITSGAFLTVGNGAGFSTVASQSSNLAAAFGYSFVFVATATTTYVFANASLNAGGYFIIDNISVRELPGNHRRQSIALNRLTLLQDEFGLYYLSYDGINDSMATASFAWGTDKATVVAGVRKLSDAAGARTIVETSTNSDSTNGTFRLGTDAATFTWRSRGTVSANPSGAGAQPITAVLTGIGDIAGDVARLRRNAAQVGEVLTDQGTGNLLTYPAYFGARAGTSLFFNGREYSQFAINRLLTTAELAQIEAYTAGKTGVVL